ncbi:MAG: flagellar biosynthesis anti-sigma factor FlgM [Gemmatimonadaceae bacterium]|nr:flagellar biosynthesis anti-sigma factor FlgM [Gemmatimonadaceae bacterium]
MRINGSIFDPLRPDRAGSNVDPSGSRPTGQSEASPVPGAGKSDSVQISDAGRSLAGRVAKDQQVDFDPERVAELRTKVLTGAYNTLDVVDQVARRILTRGDL